MTSILPERPLSSSIIPLPYAIGLSQSFEVQYNSAAMTNPTLSEQDIQNLAASALAKAKALNCTEAEVGVRAGQGMTVTARNAELEALEHHQDKSLSITVYKNGSKGSAGTTDFSEQSLTQTVTAAADIAGQSEADEHAGLLEPQFLAEQIPDLDLYHEWNVSNEKLIELALECDASAKEVDQRIEQVDDTSVNYYRGMSAYANSNGFSGSYRASRYGLSCVVVADADGAMQRPSTLGPCAVSLMSTVGAASAASFAPSPTLPPASGPSDCCQRSTDSRAHQIANIRRSCRIRVGGSWVLADREALIVIVQSPLSGSMAAGTEQLSTPLRCAGSLLIPQRRERR